MKVDVGGGLVLRVEDRFKGRGTDRAPVLLLHGFTGSAEAWAEELLEGLAARRRILAVDLPGHGGSDAPTGEGRMTLPSTARGLVGLLDRMGVERASWIGYSMGGRVALGAAVLYPERVDRLVLESASPGLATPEEREARRAQDEARARELESSGLEAFVDRWMAR
ncbi:MAG TPA: alpha/beta fold hydrolase, partial [Longimicrobiales bacterium]|nr:alpha/beta fold hydrolase [Longimicrobiales bacterium]